MIQVTYRYCEEYQALFDYFDNLILNELGNCDCWIAGGAVRDFFDFGFVNSDVDLYFSSDYEYYKANRILSQHEIIDESLSAKLIRTEKCMIHLVKKHYYSVPQETIDHFDFTVCCAAVSKNAFCYHRNFFKDLRVKELLLHSLTYPLSTLQRVVKYRRKEFTISNHTLMTIVNKIAEINDKITIENPDSYYPIERAKAVEEILEDPLIKPIIEETTQELVEEDLISNKSW